MVYNRFVVIPIVQVAKPVSCLSVELESSSGSSLNQGMAAEFQITRLALVNNRVDELHCLPEKTGPSRYRCGQTRLWRSHNDEQGDLRRSTAALHNRVAKPVDV